MVERGIQKITDEQLSTEDIAMLRVLHVVGARPNFVKAAPVISAMALYPERFDQTLVHTGQHYDPNVSDIFFTELELPWPDINLGVGSGSHAAQTALIMQCLEPVIIERKPDWVLVYGDVNSTVAAALVCAKLLIPVAHVEAGLRSFDRTMPEEINRILTDQLADLLFTPSLDGNENLIREGIPEEKIKLVGNIMIDTLVRLLPKALKRWKTGELKIDGLDLNQEYALMTLHRPSNVDDLATLNIIVAAVNKISRSVPIIFPVHPRTMARLKDNCKQLDDSRVYYIEPVGYLDFLAMQHNASLVITDSGGIQEETTFLNVPCLTLRENTERPITVTFGTNILIGKDMDQLKVAVDLILSGKSKRGGIPLLWDGRTSHRIVDILSNYLQQ